MYRIGSRHFHIDIIQTLIKHQYISKKSVYLCTYCAKYAQDNLVVDEINPKVLDICNMIKENSLTDTEIKLILKEIGTLLHSSFQDDIHMNQGCYKQEKVLKQYKPNAWLECLKSDHLLYFLECLVGRTNYNKVYMCKLVEQIFQIASVNIILPLSFSCNLVTYLVTGSRYAPFFISMLFFLSIYQSII